MPAGPKELFAKSSSVKVPTASSPYSVIFTKTADGVTVTDFQGNVAKVSKADLGMGNARVHVIDKVLFSGGSHSQQTATFAEPRALGPVGNRGRSPCAVPC